MPTICPGVEFDVIAREWRCKWSEDSDKKSLVEVQKALDGVMGKVGAVSGTKTQRVVCGGCHDFKVVISLKAEKFKKWEEAKFEPEEEFLATIKAIPGITAVETQTYTLMPVKPPPPLKKPKVWQIGRLKPDAKSFNLQAKVLSDATEVEGKGSLKFTEFTIGDKTGKITVSTKPDQAAILKKDKVFMFRNASVVMVKSHMRLVVDKWGKIDEDTEATIEEVGEKDLSATEFELVKG